MTAILICGGTLSAAFLKEVTKQYQDAVIYAVDGGLTVADEAGVIPNVLIGDFDTAKETLVSKYEAKCETVRHQPEKDATDTELAVEEAMKRGADSLVLLGATGSRMDHTLANIHMLYKVLLQGKKACILNENNRITLHNRSFRKRRDSLFGQYVSFLPMFYDVHELSLTGMKYPLRDKTLVAGTSLGVSNEAVGNEIEVSFSKGFLLMIEARD
ncbi:MAG: thiamine diphosphokinase [Lachnospiraceae bacterium]|nr:thiamine diphosphokinase [Lachnospiraceae bacterium]